MAGGLMAGTDQNRSEYRALVFKQRFVIFSRAVRLLSLIQFLTKTRCQPLCYTSLIQEDMASNIDHTHPLAKQRSQRHQRNRSRSSISADPEGYIPSRPPSPPGPSANAPPPSERVTHLRLSAHYAVLVLSSMLGCVARLGLNSLGTCKYTSYTYLREVLICTIR